MMFRVTVPSNTFYVTPELLPQVLATLAETHYVAASGEILQTVTNHELANNFNTATIAINTPEFQSLWINERNKREKLEAQLDRIKARKKRK